MTIEILSTSKRQSLFWAQLPVKSDIDFTSFIEKDFTLADQQNLKQTIEDELNLYGLTKKELQVSFDENGTTLTLDLSADLEVANIALPRFMPGLQALLAELNAKNDYKITFCKVFLKDNQGELLLRYTLDLQLAHETWWMKDGLTQDWFPHPPEE